MFGLPPVFLHFFWVIPLVLLIAYIGSPRFRGTIGQSRVRRLLSAMLQKNQYTVLNDLTIPSGGGTAHIDHLVVSQFGIFVIETVYRRGTISGTEFQDRWKQSRFGRFTRFDNPVHQNFLQIQALERLLQLPESRFHSIVVFTGHSGFKGTMPGNVVTVEKLIPHIRKRQEKRLSPEKASLALKQLDELRLNQRRGFLHDPWLLLRFALLVALLVAGWFAFGNELQKIVSGLQERVEMKSAPEKFHADGRRKSERDLWEDALRCAYSIDGGRCACYEPDGSKVELEPEKCQSLSERGSILKQ
jgi:hypothetical protein